MVTVLPLKLLCFPENDDDNRAAPTSTSQRAGHNPAGRPTGITRVLRRGMAGSSKEGGTRGSFGEVTREDIATAENKFMILCLSQRCEGMKRSRLDSVSRTLDRRMCTRIYLPSCQKF